jgi:hypothetical protein
MAEEPQGISQHRAEENALVSVLAFVLCCEMQIYVGPSGIFEAKRLR